MTLSYPSLSHPFAAKCEDADAHGQRESEFAQAGWQETTRRGAVLWR